MMNRLFLAIVCFAALLAGTAAANDPVKLLTQNDAIARIIRQETPPVIVDADKPAEPLISASGATPVANPVKVLPNKVELAAIYYYADQKQEARVKAEFARLKYKYPDFQMPDDLYKPEVERVNETPLWALYNKDDIAGVDQAIARLVATNPGWQPSGDFTAKLARKKLRNTIVSAHAQKNWAAVLAAGASLDPATEKEVDLLWDMIDAYAATGNKAALGPYYRAILFRDAVHPITKPAIIATIQKATRDFSPADIRAVVAQFASDPVVSAGLANVSADLLRRSVADFNADEKQTQPLAKETIDALKAAAASADGKVEDFALLGWYDLKIKEPADAGAWFRRALEKKQDIQFVKGLYLSLVKQDRQDEAYDLALRHTVALAADPVFLMNALAERFNKPESGRIDPTAVKAYASAILASKSGDHAEILAWYAYNSGQFDASRAWFTKAFAWEPEPTRMKGLALSVGQLGDRNALVALYQRYGDKYPDIWSDVHLNRGGNKTNHMKQRLIDEMQVGAVDRKKESKPAFLSEEEAPVARPVRRKVVRVEAEPDRSGESVAVQPVSRKKGSCLAAAQAGLSSAASLNKGWCLLDLKRTTEAKMAFTAALAGSGKTRTDAAYGLALTLLRANLTEDADSVISLYPLAPAREKEIRLSIYWQKADSAFKNGQYQRTLDALNARLALTPEPADITEMRAWAHYKLGHRAEARQIFQRLSERMETAGVRQGLAITSAPITGR